MGTNAGTPPPTELQWSVDGGIVRLRFDHEGQPVVTFETTGPGVWEPREVVAIDDAVQHAQIVGRYLQAGQAVEFSPTSTTDLPF